MGKPPKPSGNCGGQTRGGPSTAINMQTTLKPDIIATVAVELCLVWFWVLNQNTLSPYITICKQVMLCLCTIQDTANQHLGLSTRCGCIGLCSSHAQSTSGAVVRASGDNHVSSSGPKPFQRTNHLVLPRETFSLMIFSTSYSSLESWKD